MDFNVPGKISVNLYNERHHKNLNLSQIKEYLNLKFGRRMEVKIRDNFVKQFLESDRDIQKLAEKISGIRISDLKKQKCFPESNSSDILLEKILLSENNGPMTSEVIYDGTELILTLREILPDDNEIHIIFTSRMFATWDDSSRRYHGRVSIYSNPSLISTTGIVEAPARPREYYIKKGFYQKYNLPVEDIEKEFTGKFIDYNDKRLTEIMKGYALQAILFNITFDPFCDDKNCRFYNGHWQEEVLNSQLKDNFCKKHKEILRELYR